MSRTLAKETAERSGTVAGPVGRGYNDFIEYIEIRLMKKLDIGEVAKLSGLPASTLRYYEEQGLIKSIGRAGIRRVFSAKVVDQLSLISLARFAGFSLREIALMFSNSGKLKIDREQLLHKADEIDKDIKRLKILKDSLQHVAHCPEKDQLDCPNFQKLVRKAARIQQSSTHLSTPKNKKIRKK